MRAFIAFTRQLSPAYRHLALTVPGFPVTFRPGQFVMVKPVVAAAPFLARAFSIYRIGPGREGPLVEILYKVLGKGTQCLAKLAPGDPLEVLGPFGNAFALPEEGDTPILVAGGIGVPPIAALAAAISSREPRAASRDEKEPRTSNVERRIAHVLLGGRTSEDILCIKDFEEAGARVAITTEDGSLGTRGLITDLLRPFLRECRVPSAECRESSRNEREPRSIIYTCGPQGMLAAVARLAAEFGMACQTSVEASMACGFGACMGCAIEVVGPRPGPSYKLVCKDGPVFDSREIAWKDEPRAGSREPRQASAGCRVPGAETDRQSSEAEKR